MNSKKLTILFILILLVPIAISQPAFLQESTTGNQFQIIFPNFEFYEQGQNISLQFHVFNASGILRTNTTTECAFHLYNDNGSLIISNEMIDFNDDDNDFFIDINASTINNEGVYSYFIQCNDTNNGGFVSTSFTIKEGEFIEESNINIIAIILGLFFIALAFFAFGTSTESIGLKIFGYGISLIELLIIGYAIYIKELNQSLVPLLRLNFIMLFIIFGGMAVLAILIFSIRHFNVADESLEEENKWMKEKKWQK